MQKKINAHLLLALIVFSLFFSCDKENVNKDFGKYAVAVSYDGDDFLQLHFVIDGKECGALTPAPHLNPTYIEDCKALSKPERLTNIFVANDISVGKHTLEIRTVDGNVLKTLSFEMINKECVFQEFAIAVD